VEHQEGRPHILDLGQRVVLGAQEAAHRQEGVVAPRQVSYGGDGRLQDEGEGRSAGRQLHGHARAQRAAEVDDALRVRVRPREDVGQGGFGVPIGPLLRGRALAAAVAPVVEEEDGHPQLVVEQAQVLQPVADVPGVAVAPEPGDAGPAGHEPAVEPDAVAGGEGNIIEGQPEVGRVADKLPLREVDERTLYHTATDANEQECRPHGQQDAEEEKRATAPR